MSEFDIRVDGESVHTVKNSEEVSKIYVRTAQGEASISTGDGGGVDLVIERRSNIVSTYADQVEAEKADARSAKIEEAFKNTPKEVVKPVEDGPSDTTPKPKLESPKVTAPKVSEK